MTFSGGYELLQLLFSTFGFLLLALVRKIVYVQVENIGANVAALGVHGPHQAAGHLHGDGHGDGQLLLLNAPMLHVAASADDGGVLAALALVLVPVLLGGVAPGRDSLVPLLPHRVPCGLLAGERLHFCIAGGVGVLPVDQQKYLHFHFPS